MNITIRPNSRYLDFMAVPEFRNRAYADFAQSQIDNLTPIVETIASLQSSVLDVVNEMTTEELASWKSSVKNNINSLYRQVLSDLDYNFTDKPLFIENGYVNAELFIKESAISALYDEGILSDEEAQNARYLISSYDMLGNQRLPFSDSVHTYKDIFLQFKEGIITLKASAAAAIAATKETLDEKLAVFEAEMTEALDTASNSVKAAYQYFKNSIVRALSASDIMRSIKESTGASELLDKISKNEAINLSPDTKFISPISGYSGHSPMTMMGTGYVEQTISGMAYVISGLLCLVGRALEWCYDKGSDVVQFFKEVYVNPVDIEKNSLASLSNAKPSLANLVNSNYVYNDSTDTITCSGSDLYPNGVDTDHYDDGMGTVYDWWTVTTISGVTATRHHQGSPVLLKWAQILYKNGLLTKDPDAAVYQSDRIVVENELSAFLMNLQSDPLFYCCYFGEVSMKMFPGSWWHHGEQEDDHFQVYKYETMISSHDYVTLNVYPRNYQTTGMAICLKPYMMNAEYFFSWLNTMFDRWTSPSSEIYLTYGVTESNADFLTRTRLLDQLNTGFKDKWISSVESEEQAYIALYMGMIGLYYTLIIGFDALVDDTVRYSIGFNRLVSNTVPAGQEQAKILEFWNAHLPNPITNADFVALASGYHVNGHTHAFQPATFGEIPEDPGLHYSWWPGSLNDLSANLLPLFVVATSRPKSSYDAINYWIPFVDKNFDFYPSLFRLKTDSEHIVRALTVSTVLLEAACIAVAAIYIGVKCWKIASNIFTRREGFCINMWNKLSNGQTLSTWEKFKYWRYSKGAGIIAATLEGLGGITSKTSEFVQSQISSNNPLDASYENFISLAQLITG